MRAGAARERRGHREGRGPGAAVRVHTSVPPLSSRLFCSPTSSRLFLFRTARTATGALSGSATSHYTSTSPEQQPGGVYLLLQSSADQHRRTATSATASTTSTPSRWTHSDCASLLLGAKADVTRPAAALSTTTTSPRSLGASAPSPSQRRGRGSQFTRYVWQPPRVLRTAGRRRCFCGGRAPISGVSPSYTSRARRAIRSAREIFVAAGARPNCADGLWCYRRVQKPARTISMSAPRRRSSVGPR